MVFFITSFAFASVCRKGHGEALLYSSNIVRVNKPVILLAKKCDMHGKQEVHAELLKRLW